MAFPNTPILDSFPVDGALTTGWTTTGNPTVTSGLLGATTGGSTARRNSLDNVAAPFEVYVDVITVGDFRLVLNAQSTNLTSWGSGCYLLHLVSSNGQLILSKWSGGSETTLGGTGTAEIVAGDSVGILMGTGGNIEVWRKRSGTWAQRMVRTDSTWVQGYNGIYLGGDSLALDNFGGGFTGAPVLQKIIVHRVNKPQPPPPPPTYIWGTCGSVNLTSSTRQREMDDMLAVAGLCPRYDSGPTGTTIPNMLRATGFARWVALLGGSGKSFPANDQTLSYCNTYPEALIEPINESNLARQNDGVTAYWTPEQIADLQMSLYSYLKSNGVTNTVLLGSIGNSWSGNVAPDNVSIHPLEWVRRLAARGCVAGTGFDWANYHMYSNDPTGYDAWQHCWTPDGSGHSMQSYLGNPPFFVTEFGYPTSGNETAQATACTAWFNKFKNLDNCRGGCWYALSDDAPGSAGAPNYGLRRMDLTHKPAWDSYHTAATT
jgi:hypothetical protein